MAVIERLTSDSKIDKLFGVMYYLLLLMLPLSIYLYFYITEHTSAPKLLVAFGALWTWFFVITNVFTVCDYKNRKNTHKGTIDYFLSKINITQPYGIGKGFDLENDKNEDYIPILIVTGVVNCIMIFIGIIAFFAANEPSTLILAGYNAFFIFLSIFINGGTVNNKKVSPQMLDLFFEMDVISENEKIDFGRKIKFKIIENGFVTRMDVFNACYHIIENEKKSKQKSAKESEKEKYTNFINKVK